MDTNDSITTDIRYRSPSFTAEEMLSLIDCCEHYKFILFNKTTTGVVNKAKDAAWKRITKAYNQCGHRVRDLDILRNKWDNMKRLGKKVYRASLDNQDDYKDDLVTKRMTEMILEAEKYPQHDLIEDNTEALGNEIFIKGELKSKWNNDNGKEIIEDEDNLAHLNGDDDDDDDVDDSSLAEMRQRSSNFSLRETILLLKCVKAERKIILNKGTGNKANTEKTLAWDRITELFNKQNSIQRSLKVLQTKFSNMRRSKKLHSTRSIKIGMKRRANSEIKVELEPVCNLKDALKIHEDNFIDQHSNQVANSNSDPLNTFLNGTTSNGDSGEYYDDDFIQTDNQDFNKLRMELLRYQMETAKLERERTMEALATEKSRRESQSLENALRLRTARLEAVAAESKLPLGHPALNFTPSEEHIQHYFQYT